MKGEERCPLSAVNTSPCCPLRQRLTMLPASLPSGPLLFSHEGHHQFECLPAGEAKTEVFLVLGVLEFGKGKAGTRQGVPPPRDPEVSSEMGPRPVGREDRSEVGTVSAEWNGSTRGQAQKGTWE